MNEQDTNNANRMSDNIRTSRDHPSNLSIYLIAGIILICFAAGFYWYNQRLQDQSGIVEIPAEPVEIAEPPAPEPVPPPTVEVEQQPTSIEEPDDVAVEPEEPALPLLNESDSHLLNSIKEMAAAKLLLSVVTSEDILRKFVRAVYGISRGRMVRNYRPIESPEGKFQVEKIDDRGEYRIAQSNFERYDRYIDMLNLTSPKEAANLYRVYSPLLEKSFGELGVPDVNFHQVLLQAIDVLLDAPQVSDSVTLVHPTVAYQYKDKDLEQMPSTHKFMVRIGQKHRQQFELWLEELQLELQKIQPNE